MSKKSKDRPFTVLIELKLFTDTEIYAESLEEALEKARGLKITDVIQFEGSHNDSEFKVTGVFE